MRLPFFYGWVVVGACFIASASYAIFASLGVLFKVLQAEFGWGATLISSLHSIHMLTLTISAIFMGKITDRYGPRIALLITAFTLGLGFSLISRANNIYDFYIFYILSSLGAGQLFTLGPATVQRWFVKRRGLVLGIVTSGVGFGGLIIPPLVDYLASVYDWRTTYLLLGIGTFIVISLTALTLLYSPQSIGLKPYGGEEERGEGWKTKKIVKTKAFILLCLIRGLCALPIHLVLIHFVPFAMERGFHRNEAAAALGLIGGVAILGRVFGGMLLDRIGWGRGLSLFLVTSSVMLLWLIKVREPWMLFLFSVIYGLGYAAEIPALVGWTGSLFGTARLGEILGIQGAVGAIGAALGPLLGGVVFDLTHSYTIAFVLGSLSFALGLLPLGFMRIQQSR